MALAAVLAPRLALAQGVHVALIPSTLQVQPGSTFDLEIDVTQAGSNFNGFDIYIGFDPNAVSAVPLSPISLQEGSYFTSACSNRFHRFRVGVDRDTINDVLLCAGVSLPGPGQIYKLRFQASNTAQVTTLRFLPGLQFYNAGLFVNPAFSQDATITIGNPPRTIQASAGAGGSISPSGAVSVTYGGNQTFTIAPNVCQAITDVQVDGSSVGAVSSYTFTNVIANHTIAASFGLVSYTLTASAGAGGAIAPTGSVAVGCGGSQTYSITPDACHSIAAVTVDGSSVGAVTSYTFSNVTANHTIAATFALGSYGITATAGAGGTVSPSGTTSVPCGGSQSYTIAPDGCHTIADVIVDGSSWGAVSSYTFDGVTSAHTLSASFALNTENVTASAGTGGSIVPSGSVPIGCGNDRTFTITPDACQAIADVVVDGTSAGAVSSYGFTNVTTNHTITATFARVSETITAAAGSGGTIAPSGSVAVGCGGDQIFTITPDACHTLADVVVDGSSVGAVSSYTFANVTAGHSIVASFALISYSIAASAGGGGTVSPSGAVAVGCGATQVFTIAGDACHAIADVSVDGSSAGAASTYTFANVTGNHTLVASFTLLTYTIDASAGAGGTITPSGGAGVACGGSQAYAMTPDACHIVAAVLVDGSTVGAVSSYTFANVTASHTISASFAPIHYTITASAGTGGAITPSGAIAIACGGSQTFSMAPDACHTIGGILVDGTPAGALSSYTFANVTANHTISVTFPVRTFAISASAGAGGTISPSGTVSVSCGGSKSFTITPDACHTIASVVVDGSSVGVSTSYMFSNVTATHTIAASFALSVGAVTQLVATPVKTGNDTDGTTKIMLAFTPPSGAAAVEVWRKGFGNYPRYDDGPNAGAVPSVPAAYPPPGWTLTPVTSSGQTDEPAARDDWYYVAYAKDACGNASPVSAMTGGTLNYVLGDVTNGVTNGQGDNYVTTADISLLGAHYGLAGTDLAGYEYLDIGPTTDDTEDGRPLTDDQTDFSDLMIAVLDYAPRTFLAQKALPQATSGDALILTRPAAVSAGDDFDVPLTLTAGGDLQGISVSLQWDPAIVTPAGTSVGDFVLAQGGVMFPPKPGAADAALLGAGPGMSGQGAIATVHFHALASGDPAIRFAQVLGRDRTNAPVTVTLGMPLPVVSVVRVTELEPVVPNPARGRATLFYGLARRGPVDLAIYAVDGRRVRTIARGVQEPGRYQFTWNGKDDRGSDAGAGIYFARLDAPGIRRARLLTLVR